VLFDTGADGVVLLDNMAALGLDPRAINIVVLSHIHDDHTGGLAAVLAANSQACTERGERITVYLPRAFPAWFKEEVRVAGASVTEVNASWEILPGVWSTGQMGTDIVEQALIAKTAQGLVLVTGCAHPGIDRMVAQAEEVGGGQVRLVVGGFHLGRVSRERVDEIIAEFRRLGVQQVAPCHCTGNEARALFRQAFGKDFVAIGAGWQRQSQLIAWEPSS